MSIAIYLRVSSRTQDMRSQEADLRRWAQAQGVDAEVTWYRDVFTGPVMQRPGMNALMSAVRSGTIRTLVVWRLDRLGRTASGLTTLFEELIACNVNLVSMKEGLDLSTPAGRLMANVLASVAAFETEVRKERQAAGIAAARAAGKTWGGSAKGRRLRVTDEHIEIIKQLHAEGERIATIARVTGLSRQTVYATLRA